MEKARGRKADVANHMAKLGGRSRNDLADDKTRGASSPLGPGAAKKGKGR